MHLDPELTPPEGAEVPPADPQPGEEGAATDAVSPFDGALADADEELQFERILGASRRIRNELRRVIVGQDRVKLVLVNLRSG